MLLNMLLVSPAYVQRVRRDEDEVDIGARNEMRSLLKKKNKSKRYLYILSSKSDTGAFF